MVIVEGGRFTGAQAVVVEVEGRNVMILRLRGQQIILCLIENLMAVGR